MTLRASLLSNGLPDEFRVWESFVRLVLEITVEGYQCMRQDGVTQRDWEEDAFTVRLTEDYIQPLAQQHPLNLVAMAQTRVHTPAMKAGAVSPKQAPEIDIRLFSSWMNYAPGLFCLGMQTSWRQTGEQKVRRLDPRIHHRGNPSLH